MATMHHRTTIVHYTCIAVLQLRDHELTKSMQMCHSITANFVLINQLVAKLHQIMQGVKIRASKDSFGLFIIIINYYRSTEEVQI